MRDDHYRTGCLLDWRFRNTKRFIPVETQLHGWSVKAPDAASLVSTYKQLFVDRIYDFRFKNDAPKILDLGANIGLSILRFKKLFPKAKITAFEADPEIFKYLEENIRRNGIEDVDLRNQAAWYENTTLRFFQEGADGGHIATGGDSKGVDVPAVNLADLLQKESFDFLKMDIEGAEEIVLPICRDYLNGVSYIFVEYHSRLTEPQRLHEIMDILAKAGFRIHVQGHSTANSPFLSKPTHAGFDLQLNIFGNR